MAASRFNTENFLCDKVKEPALCNVLKGVKWIFK